MFTNSQGSIDTTAATLTVNTVLGLSPTTLPNGAVNTLYNQQITATGGTTPYTAFTVTGFSAGTTGLTSGAFIMYSSAVVIRGTPTAPGSASFTVNVTDALGATLTLGYTIAVQAAGTPTISSVSPAHPLATDGDQNFTINGNNFDASAYVNLVDNDGFPHTLSGSRIISQSSTQITVNPNFTSSGAGTWQAQVIDGSGMSSSLFPFLVVQSPTVTSVSPSSGSTAGGTVVTITGTNLTGATTVYFGTLAASSFTVNSTTQITATSPAESANAVDVKVTTASGTSSTSSSDLFTYESIVPALTTTMLVTGNGHPIAAGDVTPLATDGTDSGNVAMPAPGSIAAHTFIITNAGSATLTDNITISGANASDFAITKAALASVAVGSSTTFIITFNPLHLGTRTATVTIDCNDSTNPVYTFNVQGTGTTDLFDAAFYLRMNADVAAAVKAGAFTSANQHFVLYGTIRRGPGP